MGAIKVKQDYRCGKMCIEQAIQNYLEKKCVGEDTDYKMGVLQALIAVYLERQELEQDFIEFLKERLNNFSYC